MADTRTLRQKLQAMAERGTPNEAAIAKEKLAQLGPEPSGLVTAKSMAEAVMYSERVQRAWREFVEALRKMEEEPETREGPRAIFSDPDEIFAADDSQYGMTSEEFDATEDLLYKAGKL